jgi:hypothetical protein
MIEKRYLMLIGLVALMGAGPAARTTVLDPRLHHLRAEGEREWSDFPPQPEGPSLSLRFQAERNGAEWAPAGCEAALEGSAQRQGARPLAC